MISGDRLGEVNTDGILTVIFSTSGERLIEIKSCE